MDLFKKLGKGILFLVSLPILYGLIGLGCSEVSIHADQSHQSEGSTIFLSTNGVHLDIVLPIQLIDSNLLKDLRYRPMDQYLAFGWGDENFYLNTPTWADMTIENAARAMLLNSSTLIHLSRYAQASKEWVAVPVGDTSLKKLNAYLTDSFQQDEKGKKILLAKQGYGPQDDFYQAKGSYSCLYTCNTWVNSGFKRSGLRACWWTPFDFGLLRKYR